MDKVILNADLRTGTGKEANKKVRTAGNIPAVVYKKGKESLMLAVGAKDFNKVLHTSAGGNVIVTLKVKGETKKKSELEDKTVMIKEIQYDPVKGGMLHVDFYEISLTEKITIEVAVELKGEAVGVKSDGGVLDQPLKTLRVECLPTSIPEKIELQIAAMKIGDAVRVRELNIPPDVKVLNDPDLTVVTISSPKVEVTAAEAAAAGAEVTEPEMIREKKLEAEEGAAEEKKEEKEAKPAKGKE